MFPVQKKCIVNKACNIVQKIILSALITIVATLYFFYGKQVSNLLFLWTNFRGVNFRAGIFDLAQK